MIIHYELFFILIFDFTGKSLFSFQFNLSAQSKFVFHLKFIENKSNKNNTNTNNDNIIVRSRNVFLGEKAKSSVSVHLIKIYNIFHYMVDVYSSLMCLCQSLILYCISSNALSTVYEHREQVVKEEKYIVEQRKHFIQHNIQYIYNFYHQRLQ